MNIELIESSFEQLSLQGDNLVECFYERLFEGYPELKVLFADVDMDAQRAKLLASLALVVSNLRNEEILASALQQLGQRHIDYGAVDAHYPLIVKAMMQALAETAGDSWNDELQLAWSQALDQVVLVMKQGAEVLRQPTGA